ncbi:MAG: dUTP diphosphatase [Clostridia bacterium]|nr:dUTP diphosphatase [Clostridia bacterium]
MTVKIVKLQQNAHIPTYGSADAAGADLYACIDEAVTIQPSQTVLIPTGLSMEIEQGFAGFIYARSGLATKRGLAPANKVGVIDSDYRGQVMVSLHNHTDRPQTVEPGERVAQMVFAPVYQAQFCEVDALQDTERGTGGFGSTGTK